MRIADSQRSLLELLLTPLVRYFLRKSLTIQTFYDVAKTVFISAAVEELERSGEAVNVSRISAATGVTRNEVTRIYKKRELPAVRTGMSIAARVMGQWELDPRFSSKNRTPRVLTVAGEDSDFRRLVHSVSKTLNPSTVLKELERIGAIERTARGVKLVKDVDRSADEERWRVELAAQDIGVLLQAVDENIAHPEAVRNHHIHTEADNIVATALPEIREWLLAEGKKFHKKLRAYLSRHDADLMPDLEPGSPVGRRVTFASFSLTSPLPPAKPPESSTRTGG